MVDVYCIFLRYTGSRYGHCAINCSTKSLSDLLKEEMFHDIAKGLLSVTNFQQKDKSHQKKVKKYKEFGKKLGISKNALKDILDGFGGSVSAEVYVVVLKEWRTKQKAQNDKAKEKKSFKKLMHVIEKSGLRVTADTYRSKAKSK